LLPWLVLVALFSLAPDVPRVPGISDDTAAVAGHFLIYAGLTALVYRLHMRALAGPGRRPLHSAGFAVVTAASAGLMFEWAQAVFTDMRTFQPEDVVSNALGAFTMAAVLVALEANGSRLMLLSPVVMVAGATLATFAGLSYSLWDPLLPYRGDHWHAGFTLVICGETQPPFPTGHGNIHTHGDGYIHIHPQSRADEGRNANLGAFFRSAGGQISDTSITLPSGEAYSNGDRCPDGAAGSVTVARPDDGTLTRIVNAANYVPRDREWLLIKFGSAVGDTNRRD
jgi:hypothetical protein